jgi:hypothetical protein
MQFYDILKFAGGGGRAAAAGVDELPAGEVERFAAAFRKAFALQRRASSGTFRVQAAADFGRVCILFDPCSL